MRVSYKANKYIHYLYYAISYSLKFVFFSTRDVSENL